MGRMVACFRISTQLLQNTVCGINFIPMVYLDLRGGRVYLRALSVAQTVQRRVVE
jgi:hypothetical protein